MTGVHGRLSQPPEGVVREKAKQEYNTQIYLFLSSNSAGLMATIAVSQIDSVDLLKGVLC